MDYVQSVVEKSVHIVTAGGMNRTDDAKLSRGVSTHTGEFGFKFEIRAISDIM